jgi:uncharacterized protein
LTKKGYEMGEDQSPRVPFQPLALQTLEAFPSLLDDSPGCDGETARVQLLETHISWIFLAGPFAYKVKKPVKTAFLDYRSLEARQRYCAEELRINRQFAPELYIAVVPIVARGEKLAVEAEGEPIEAAVKMHRFGSQDLLSDRLWAGQVKLSEIERLAERIARFHAAARVVAPSDHRVQSTILGNAIENLTDLQPVITGEAAAMLRSLQIWTRDLFEELEPIQQQRFKNGFVRECHGDMHAGNIVHWKGDLLPFDGIEFNDSFRCIDVLNDLAFLSMDLLARGHNPLRHALINAYVELTADREALALLRWYEVYRALVRAKVAHIRWQQLRGAGSHGDSQADQAQQAYDECHEHIRLAHLLAEQPSPTLTITRGLSGSGKSTASHRLVTQRGAIRLRADVERKRLFGLRPLDRPGPQQLNKMYSHEASAKTYALLLSLAEEMLRAGYSVVIDATFLKLNQRRSARESASRLGVEFNILDCDLPESLLRDRLVQRLKSGDDASDADLQVLDQQLAGREPLTDDEMQCTIAMSSVVETG